MVDAGRLKSVALLQGQAAGVLPAFGVESVEDLRHTAGYFYVFDCWVMVGEWELALAGYV